jgi:hypothetical protein
MLLNLSFFNEGEEPDIRHKLNLRVLSEPLHVPHVLEQIVLCSGFAIPQGL